MASEKEVMYALPEYIFVRPANGDLITTSTIFLPSTKASTSSGECAFWMLSSTTTNPSPSTDHEMSPGAFSLPLVFLVRSSFNSRSTFSVCVVAWSVVFSSTKRMISSP